MPLSKDQVLAIQALDWLCGTQDHHRRSGRTTAQAVWVIRQALARPGQLVRLTDHFNWIENRNKNNSLIDEVLRMKIAFKIKKLSYIRHPGAFIYEGPANIDWWPDISMGFGITPAVPIEKSIWDHLQD